MRRSSRVLLVGIFLGILGIGNVWVGTAKTSSYSDKMHRAVAIGGPSVAQTGTAEASILEPITDAHLRYESAAMKYEYYKLIRRGGVLLLLLGTTLAVAATVRKLVVPDDAMPPSAPLSASP